MNRKYLEAIYVCLVYFAIKFILHELLTDHTEYTYSLPVIAGKILDIVYSLGALFFLFNDNYKLRNSGIGLGALISVIFIDMALRSGYMLFNGLKALRGEQNPYSIPFINAVLNHIAIPVIVLLLGWFWFKKKKWELSTTALLTGLIYVMVALISSSLKFLFINDHFQQ